ncbi:hypothetical protein HYH03_018249 [Edaphochlamys debaryana]|uniref:Uncharacterized protein n=1 Tax=Edaphochlamys debaryana TaxID=47281 RepID=A0A836BPL4_9CHLO|nr:hypothetical protein HYH03_018249 [Edaphochlamys debaryana]|eukprot:KAG2482859.1 hypothetical protein HYH03_018249 [Edaphochlamys debaryana]
MASYGSCTATLEPSPGTTVSIFVTYLTAELMERMHATEGGYNLVQLGGLAMHVAPRGPASAGAAKDAGSGAHAGAGRHMGAGEPCFELRSWAYQYNHKLGCIELPLAGGGGSPIAIAEIPATGRRFPAATQTQMLAALRVALGDEPAEGGELKPVPAPGSSAVAGAGSAEAQDLDAWILAVVNNPTKQRRACKRLALHARAFEYPQAEVVAAL